MPIAINPNRPNSSNSNKLPNNGPPRPTATSRRGGRTRSRSPAVVMMGGAGGPGVGGASSRMVGSPTGEPPPGIPVGGLGNPSSAAAAAAAAAAKAYATGAGPGRWGKPEGNNGPPPPPPGGVMGDPYSHHGGPGGAGGGGPPPPYHGGAGAGGPPPPPHHGHPNHPNSGGPGQPPPPGHHPPPYGYDNRGGWPPEDSYGSSRGRPDGPNPNSGGGPSSRPPYPYDPYGRGPGGNGPPPGRPPPPPSQSSGQSSMGPPAHPHDPEGRYSHHPPSSRGRYEHPGMGSRQQQQQQQQPPPSGTPNSGYHRGGYDSRHGPPPPQQHHSSQHPPSSGHGPPGPPPQGMSSPRPPSQSPHHPMYSPQDFAGNRYSSSGSGRDRPPDHHHPPPHHHPHPSRHPSSNSSVQNESRRGPGGPQTPQQPPTQGPSITRSSPNPSGGGGTTIVIGGSKPIHLPKPTSSPSHESPKVSGVSSSLLITPNSPLERPSARTSIFRDRPSDDKMSAHRNSASKHNPARGRSDSDSLDGKRKSKKDPTILGNEDSPHNILLSLRTPTTSFEENNDKTKTDNNEGSNKRSKRGSKKDDDDDNDTIQRNNSTNPNRQSPLNRSATDQLYETQRSNDFLKPNGSIDLAPSFNILNASFDSLTDGPYFTLDSTLGQTESFDFKRTDSIGGDQLLGRTSSVGNFSTQLLATGSTPGIGYSPVNSFGTTAGGYRRTSSTGASSLMLVGGVAGDSGAPLDSYGTGRDSSRHRQYRSDDIDTNMFRSYSGGAGPLDDSHLRMSVGSFGYSRSYAEPSSPGGGGYYASNQADTMDPQLIDRGERNHPPHHSQGPPPQPAPSQHPHHPYSSGSSSRHHGYNPHHHPPPHSYDHPNQHYHRGAITATGGGGSSSSRIPSFYTLLRKYRAAFKGCTFLLPGLKSAVLELSFRDNDNTDESKKWDPLGHGYHQPRPTPQDNAIARRRVECSICAFGGNVSQEHSINAPNDKQSGSSRSSIFREKEGKNPPTVTPSSTEVSSKGRVEQSPGRVQYDEALAGRYYENESRLSWEFEEEPPIEVPEHTSEYPTEPYVDKLDDDDDDDDDRYEIDDSPTKEEDKDKASQDKTAKPDISDSPEGEKKEKEVKTEKESKEDKTKSGDPEDFDGRSASPTPSGKSRNTNSSPQSKMKYRCKLCGQPKQNHRCPFQQSLARTIGVMVYPAVNAFTADEPGTIAAPLSEMNNFFDIVKQESQMAGDSSVGGASAEVTPDRAGGPAGGSVHGPTPTNMVSPDSLRSSSNNPIRSSSSQHSSYRHGATPNNHRSSGSIHSSGGGGGKKRGHSEMNQSRPPPPHHRSEDTSTNQQGDLLFLDAMELKPEQFRVVSQSATKTLQSVDAFKYPALPLPYAQRKRLSDNLFSLSNDVAKLTDECAQVLREAREKDMWDLAVAELMTQVIIVLHCPYNDYQLEGLRQYLLTLGIAC